MMALIFNDMTDFAEKFSVEKQLVNKSVWVRFIERPSTEGQEIGPYGAINKPSDDPPFDW
jgi:hypothetical protein